VAFQAFKGIDPVITATVTRRYFQVLHLRIGAPGSRQWCMTAWISAMAEFHITDFGRVDSLPGLG
jgi:hypothetical protein